MFDAKQSNNNLYKINIQLFPQAENLNINIFNTNRFLIVPIPLPRDKLPDENIVRAAYSKAFKDSVSKMIS